MAAFGDFSTLLQLGVALGLGISVFQAPLEVRNERLEQKIQKELLVLRDAKTSFAVQKRRDLNDLLSDIKSRTGKLRSWQDAVSTMAILGSINCVSSLIVVTFKISDPIDSSLQIVFSFISVFYFAILIAFWEIVVQFTFNPLQLVFDKIEDRQNL